MIILPGGCHNLLFHTTVWGCQGMPGSESFNPTGAGLRFVKNTTCYLNLCNSNSSHAIPSTKGWSYERCRRLEAKRARERDFHNSGIFWPGLPDWYYRVIVRNIPLLVFIFSLAATMKEIFTRIIHTFYGGKTSQMVQQFWFSDISIVTGLKTSVLLGRQPDIGGFWLHLSTMILGE